MRSKGHCGKCGNAGAPVCRRSPSKSLCRHRSANEPPKEKPMIEIEERFTPVEHKRAEPIYVTRPDLPSLEEFIPYLREIWNTKVLTNGGPFHQQLEQKLCGYLGVKHIALFSNGPIGLVTALQPLRISV